MDLFKPNRIQRHQKVLEFPVDQILGRLYYSTNRGYAFLDYARGTVVVPSGLSLLLRVDSNVHSLAPLCRIQPDAFDLVSLAHTSLGNDELRHLGALTGLKALLLDYTRLSGLGLKWLRNAKPYFLSGRMSCFSDEGSAHLAALSSLTSIDLSDSRVTDCTLDWLASLEKVESLSLWENRITSGAAANLGRMKTLQTLCLGGTIFGDEGAACLQTLERLNTLELPRTAITDEALAALALIPQLSELGLSCNKVGDRGVKHLSKCYSLRKIALSRTAVTDNAMPYLIELPKLEELDLSSTAVTDRCLPNLAGLPSLKRLTLHETKISPQAVQQLQQKHPELVVSWTPITQSAEPPQLAGRPLHLPDPSEPTSVNSKVEQTAVSA